MVDVKTLGTRWLNLRAFLFLFLWVLTHGPYSWIPVKLHLNFVSSSEILIKFVLEFHIFNLGHNVWISVYCFCFIEWRWFRWARYGVLFERF